MKSQGLGFLLTFLFGPLGLLYSTVIGAIIMILVAIVLGLLTFGFGFFFAWPICWIVSIVVIKSHNARVEAKENARHQEIVDAMKSNDTKAD